MDLGTLWSTLVCELLMALDLPHGLQSSKISQSLSENLNGTYGEESVGSIELAVFLRQTEKTFPSDFIGFES